MAEQESDEAIIDRKVDEMTPAMMKKWIGTQMLHCSHLVQTKSGEERERALEDLAYFSFFAGLLVVIYP